MIKYLKKLWNSKLQINIQIIYPVEGVNRITEPEVVDREFVSITRKRQSDLRFVEEYKKDHNGKERTYWFTERREGKSWMFVSETMSSNKDEAMALHLKIAERGTLKPESKKTVMWEGLDKDETASWVAMNSSSSNE